MTQVIDQKNARVDLVFKLYTNHEIITSFYHYPLFSAISNLSPQLSHIFHTSDKLGIFPLRFDQKNENFLKLGKNTDLIIRAPCEEAKQIVQNLKNKKIKLSDTVSSWPVQYKGVQPLTESSEIYSSCVFIKSPHLKTFSEANFIECLYRQIESIAGKDCENCEIELPKNQNGNVKFRYRKIKKDHYKGVPVHLKNLTPQQSLLVQHSGLGGKRKFGCGLFFPINNK